MEAPPKLSAPSLVCSGKRRYARRQPHGSEMVRACCAAGMVAHAAKR